MVFSLIALTGQLSIFYTNMWAQCSYHNRLGLINDDKQA